MRTALHVIALLTLAGCALGEAPPRPRLLTVSPAPAVAAGAAVAAAPAASAASAPVLVLRRVELPEYLLARRVRYRDDVSTLAEWPDTVWAERLEAGVTRELAAALRQRLPGWTVCDSACADGSAGDAVLRVEFATLDLRRAERRLQGSATAQLSQRNATRWSWAQSIDLPVSADTPQAHADAIGAALGAVADALAARVRAAP
jgi:uncharacterized lipoprotein YmbA